MHTIDRPDVGTRVRYVGGPNVGREGTVVKHSLYGFIVHWDGSKRDWYYVDGGHGLRVLDQTAE